MHPFDLALGRLQAGSARCAHFAFLRGSNIGTSTMILASKHETPWRDEEPQTNAKNAYV